jgi:hypothetical protein
MCNSEGYGYLHSDWYCEAANGPNGIGEDLQVYAAISAADCVTQCAIDYSNRIGHMCSDVGYDTFYSTYYCEAGSGPRGPGEDLGVFLAISAADCVSQCVVDYSNRANHMCNNVAYDYLFATYYCEAGSGPNGPGENLGVYVTTSATDCVAQCAADYANRQGHMCNDESYDYFHSNWYCEADSGPNGPGEDLGVFSAIGADDCVAQCAADYSNRQGHMCNDESYDDFHSNWYCEAADGPSGPGEDLGVYSAISAADCVSQCTVDYSNRQGHMCNNVNYGYLHTVYYCEALSGPNGAGENLGTFQVLNTLPDGAADCVAQCAADYSNRQGHMCNTEGWGTFHSNWYCEAGFGSVNGAGEDLGVFSAVSAADCVNQCTADYSNRINNMCSNVGYNQFHTPFYCEAGPGSVNGDGEDLGTFMAQTAAECVIECEIDYSNRIGHMCNRYYFGYFHRPWYCEAADGEDLGTYGVITEAYCLAECGADYGHNRPQPFTCSRLGYGAFHKDYYCEALSGPNGAGEDLGTFHATSEADCVTQCAVQYTTRQGHMCNNQEYDLLFSTFYCEASDGEDLGVYSATGLNNCIDQCVADNPRMQGHMCSSEGYGYLHTTWYCESGDAEDLQVFYAASTANCLDQCTAAYSDHTGHMCNDVGYGVLFNDWFCEAGNGDDLQIFAATSKADCLSQCAAAHPTEVEHTCNGFGFAQFDTCSASSGAEPPTVSGALGVGLAVPAIAGVVQTYQLGMRISSIGGVNQVTMGLLSLTEIAELPAEWLEDIEDNVQPLDGLYPLTVALGDVDFHVLISLVQDTQEGDPPQIVLKMYTTTSYHLGDLMEEALGVPVSDCSGDLSIFCRLRQLALDISLGPVRLDAALRSTGAYTLDLQVTDLAMWGLPPLDARMWADYADAELAWGVSARWHVLSFDAVLRRFDSMVIGGTHICDTPLVQPFCNIALQNVQLALVSDQGACMEMLELPPLLQSVCGSGLYLVVDMAFPPLFSVKTNNFGTFSTESLQIVVEGLTGFRLPEFTVPLMVPADPSSTSFQPRVAMAAIVEMSGGSVASLSDVYIGTNGIGGPLVTLKVSESVFMIDVGQDFGFGFGLVMELNFNGMGSFLPSPVVEATIDVVVSMDTCGPVAEFDFALEPALSWNNAFEQPGLTVTLASFGGALCNGHIPLAMRFAGGFDWGSVLSGTVHADLQMDPTAPQFFFGQMSCSLDPCDAYSVLASLGFPSAGGPAAQVHLSSMGVICDDPACSVFINTVNGFQPGPPKTVPNYGSAEQELITVPGGIGLKFGTPNAPGIFYMGLQGHAEMLLQGTSGSITASLGYNVGGGEPMTGVCAMWSGGVNFACEL